MTRLRYTHGKGILTCSVTVPSGTISATISESTIVRVYKNNNLVSTSSHTSLRNCKKFIKKTFTSMGVSFYGEVRKSNNPTS